MLKRTTLACVSSPEVYPQLSRQWDDYCRANVLLLCSLLWLNLVILRSSQVTREI